MTIQGPKPPRKAERQEMRSFICSKPHFAPPLNAVQSEEEASERGQLLNAIKGTMSESSRRGARWCHGNGRDTVALVDTGASHNFVSDSGKRDEVVELKHPLRFILILREE